ncbi:MAG: ABC transporter substrate-binding protein [Thermotogae bacterium]|nr:ABC transporter substrate-binding protein [Thermotogota bacterium]
MKRFLVLVLVGIVVVGILAFAGGTANYALLSDVTSLNIWSMLGPNATAWNFYPTLGKYGTLYGMSDLTYQVVPSLADGFWSPLEKVTEGGTTMYVTTVKLLKGVTWSDGTPFTADDVVFSYEVPFKLQMPGNWMSNLPPDLFVKVVKVDDYTVKFYITHPSGNFIYSVLMSVIVQKKFYIRIYQEALKQKDPAQYMMSYDKNLLSEPSIGAFTVSQWQKGAYLLDKAIPNYTFKGQQEIEYANGAIQYVIPSLNQNNTYYGTPEGTVNNKFVTGPYVDSIIYRIYQNQTAAVSALLKSEVDYILNPNGLQKGFIQQLQTNPNVKIVSNPSLGFQYIAFNMRRYPMNNKAFRVAIAYLIDRDLLANKILGGNTNPLSSLVPPGNKFWYDPDLKAYGEGMTTIERYQVAIKTLKDAGFSWLIEPKIQNGQLVQRGQGLIGPDGKLVKQITMMAPSAGYDPIRSTTALWVEKWANDIGIPLYADLTSFNNIVDAVFNQNFNFDMYILGWGITIYPDYIYEFFSSDQNVPGGFNAPGYNNPDFEKVAKAFLDATDMNVARQYAFKAEEYLNADVPYIVLYAPQVIEGYRADKISFAYTQCLDGIQSGYSGYGEPTYVQVIQ